MNQIDYAYGVAYIRAIENRLLSKTDFENLIQAKSNQEAMQILLDKGYSSDQAEPEDFEALLSNQLQQCWNEVREVAPEGAPLDVLLYKNDFHNYKVVLKGINQGKKDYESLLLEPNTIDYKKMVSAVANRNFDNLPDMLRQPAQESYEILTRTADSQLSDVIIDRAAMDYTLKEARASHSDFLFRYVLLQNTLTDIKIAARCAKTDKTADFMDRALSEKSDVERSGLIKAALSSETAVYEYLTANGFEEAGKLLSQSISQFEKYADNLVTEFVRGAKYITFGIEPMIAYLHAKLTEIQTVRIIMAARLHGFPEDEIRQRIRESA